MQRYLQLLINYKKASAREFINIGRNRDQEWKSRMQIAFPEVIQNQKKTKDHIKEKVYVCVYEWILPY